MSTSRLSRKISLCEMIDHLNQDACVAVIQSIYHELECANLNALLIRMILQWTDSTTTQSFESMKNMISFLIDDNNTKLLNSHNNSRLLQLPIDLICQTSLFLNEKDIFNFEKCCRLFYQTINKSSYLNQSNNFKTLIVNPSELLIQYTNSKYSWSFYKYSKPTTLILKNTCQSSYDYRIKKQWKKVQAAFDNDTALSTMLNSIRTLQIEKYGEAVLSKLPINELFDPDNFHINCKDTVKFQM